MLRKVLVFVCSGMVFLGATACGAVKEVGHQIVDPSSEANQTAVAFHDENVKTPIADALATPTPTPVPYSTPMPDTDTEGFPVAHTNLKGLLCPGQASATEVKTGLWVKYSYQKDENTITIVAGFSSDKLEYTVDVPKGETGADWSEIRFVQSEQCVSAWE